MKINIFYLTLLWEELPDQFDPQYTESAMIIDYVRVYQENPLSIEDTINAHIKKTLKIYPNPVKNEINLISEEPNN